MALPSYYVSVNRKDLAEKAIVAKREKEALRVRKCQEVASYHQDLALKSSKYRSLEHPEALKIARANEESRIKEEIKAMKRDKLEIRRNRLAHFLALENDQYVKELNELKEREKDKGPWNVCKLREQIEDLQRKRKEGEQNMQKRYMHHLYRSTEIYQKEDEDEKLKKDASQAWKQRKEELEKLSLEKKQKEVERMKTFELEQMKATKEAAEVEILQLEEQEKLSQFVQSKMGELSVAESEAKNLKFERQLLMGHMETLLSLQQRRDLVRDIQRKGAQRIKSFWQPKEKLRRMSNEVQHALDLDLKMLASICNMNDSATEETAFALLNLDLANDLRGKIESQIAMEKDRELEIQQLYNEEATKMWEKRQDQWSLETIARDELINDLFKSLSEDIAKKIENNVDQQRKFLHMKENCIKEIEEANENAKSKRRTLDEKMAYFVDKAKRLGDELQAYKSPCS